MRFSLPHLPEAHILSDILAAYKRAKEFGNKTGYFYATDDDLRAFFQSFAERHVADIVAKAKPSAALVLKDPNFIQVLDEADDLFPARFALFACATPGTSPPPSCKSGRGSLQTKPGKYERRDINFISKKVLASYQPLLQTRQPPKAVMVRYEDMASDPKGALEALARDTGLDLSLDRIDRPVWLDAEARHEASWITELEGAEASPSSIGSFKRVLNGDEIAIVQQICEPIMSQFGYAPVEDSAPDGGPALRFFGLKKAHIRKC